MSGSESEAAHLINTIDKNPPALFVLTSSPKSNRKATPLIDKIDEHSRDQQLSQTRELVLVKQKTIKKCCDCLFHGPISNQFTPLISTRSIQRSRQLSRNRSRNFFNDETDEFHANDTKLSMWSAGFTIVNIYVGLGLLSYPYALYQGGLSAFLILAIMTIFMSWTGKLLVRCFIRMKESKKTYPDVGFAAFGSYGSYIVSLGIMFEFFGLLCTNCIFLWDNVQYGIDSFADVDFSNISIIALCCSAAALPACWFLNLNEMIFVSLIGCMCKILALLSVVISFVLNFDYVKDNIANNKLSMYPKDERNLSICVGIFILSFCGHPVLPGVYNAMKEPEKFEILLDRCFVVLFVLYGSMALLGYMQFGEDTSIIITNNLMQMGGETVVVAQILVFFIVCGIYFGISPLMALLSEIPEIMIFDMKNRNMQRVFRSAMFVFVSVFSYLVMGNLAVVEAVTGSVCTMITSVICPALFYYGLYTNYISINMRVVLILCSLVGVILALLLLFNEIMSLIN